MFGRNYHCGLLWALEVLAWNPDYLNRVCIYLTRLATYTLPRNMGNNPAATLRSIFLTWFPQTLANVDARRIAVEKIIEENFDVGWNLLLAILPETHQVSDYNQKPVWRDWIDGSWTEGVTRSEMNRQIHNYAELAVRCAVNDFSKMTELISRWDHLPREIFQNILEFLSSPAIAEHPEAERFMLWQKLTDEAQRHRRFATADWAMPEEEVRRLEETAHAIKPTKASIVNQRLFNHYGIEFYATNNYEEEEKKLAQRREQAVTEIITQEGIAQIIEVAKFVKQPRELGSALGRVGNADSDAFLLPNYLDSNEQAILDLVCGYVWARYFMATFEWVLETDTTTWTLPQQIAFFAALPFHAVVWRLAAKRLKGATEEYWGRIWPNVFQAKDDLLEAVTCALDNKRADLAVHGINALLHLKQEVSSELCVRALKEFAANDKTVLGTIQHELVQVIKHLQESPDVNLEDMIQIEFKFLRLLDRFSEGGPVFLERKLATDPNFFHEAIKICYRSEHEANHIEEPTEKKSNLIKQFFRLLHDWKTPPGTIDGKSIDEAVLLKWIEQSKALCVSSGHWAIAQQTIGQAFVFPPAGLDGMLENTAAAKVLDTSEYDDMRIGFRVALFNKRGVYGFTHGREELEIAQKYRDYATRYDAAKFTLIAATLRSLADSYERDAERESKRNPFQHD